MRHKSMGSGRPANIGTEYARSIARHRPRRRKSSSWTSYFNHPLAPALTLGIIAAGAFMFWPRSAHGTWREEHDGDVDYADFPPRGRSARSAYQADERSFDYID